MTQGPYKIVTGIEDGRGGAVWRIEGPRIVLKAFNRTDDAESYLICLNAAYTAGRESVLQREAEASRHPTSDTSGPDPAADRNRPA